VTPMDLEEKTLEQVGDRCEECGAKLTPRELEQVLEAGGPALCAIHAQEEVPLSDEEDLEEEH
jgi:methionyl-tRNA synthetase